MKTKIIKFIVSFSLLFTLLSTIKAEVNIVNRSIYNIENFTQACCNELGIDNIFISIVETTKLGNVSIIYQVDENIYTIYVSSVISYLYLQEVISHEIVHIKQSRNKKFNITKGTTIIGQNGEFIRYKDKQSRIIEEEAKKIGKILFYKFKDLR